MATTKLEFYLVPAPVENTCRHCAFEEALKIAPCFFGHICGDHIFLKTRSPVNFDVAIHDHELIETLDDEGTKD
jgi:hypothetical protein